MTSVTETTPPTSDPEATRQRPRPTNKKPRATGAGAAPAKTRRRPLLIALGIAIVCLAVIGGYAFWNASSRSVAVIVVKSPIAKGETISSANLRSLQVAGGQQITAYTVDQADEILGKIATTNLQPGAIVSPSDVGTQLAVQGGKSVVGVALAATQMPGMPLAAGEKVSLVDTPVTQGDPPASTPRTYSGTVFHVSQDTKTGDTIIDVIVSSSDAPTIAATAATGRIALIVDSGE